MTDKFCMVFSAGPRSSEASAHPGEYVKTSYGSLNWKRNVVALKGRAIVTAPADTFWGDEGSKPYTSKVLDNPTWGQLFACAKAQQRKTLDLHHCYFEGYYRDGTIVAPDGSTVTKLSLSLGS